MSLERAITELAKTDLPAHDLSAMFIAISGVVRSAMGGSSGPLFAGLQLISHPVFFMRVGTSLANAPGDYAAAFSAGVDAMTELGGAQVGDW
ncbi:MAG TPA: DAK2 domain-containing protein [Candidatus Obscuribacterales bacterium]